jgi:hypothetical protein
VGRAVPPMASRLPPAPARPHQCSTPEIGRVALHGATLHFRTAPRHLGGWLRRIDKWIAYANSIVAE